MMRCYVCDFRVTNGTEKYWFMVVFFFSPTTVVTFWVFLLAGSSLVSSTGEPIPSTARQYSGLTRKYTSDAGDELAACLPPDLRHLLSATSSATPSSQQRQLSTQRLQQHGILRSSAATAAASSLVSLFRDNTPNQQCSSSIISVRIL